MTSQNRISNQNHDSNIRAWRYGDPPIPDWVLQLLDGDIQPNGTYTLETDRGQIRLHPGDTVIEQHGKVWARSNEDAPEFIAELKMNTNPIASIGPGKVSLYGANPRRQRKANNSGSCYLPPVGSLPSIEWIHLHRLSIDSTYQRSTENETSRRLIASIAARFDWRLCAPLVVSRRTDDTLAIIDGQHRWLAARERNDIPQLPCCVFKYDSMKEEARMFIVANRARRPINHLDDYYAALAAEDEDALEIEQLVTAAGLRISRNTSSTAWQPGEIAFTSAIASALRKFGSPVTSAALASMAVAFAGQRLTHGRAIFGGLLRFLSCSVSDFDPDRLTKALQTRTVDEWGAYASGFTNGGARLAAVHDSIMEGYSQPLSPPCPAPNDD